MNGEFEAFDWNARDRERRVEIEQRHVAERSRCAAFRRAD